MHAGFAPHHEDRIYIRYVYSITLCQMYSEAKAEDGRFQGFFRHLPLLDHLGYPRVVFQLFENGFVNTFPL